MKRKHIARYHQEFAGSRLLAAITWKIVYPFMAALLALGSIFMLPIQAMAQVQVASGTMNVGTSPASMNVANFNPSQAIFYDKNFVKNLKANTCWLRVCARRELPEYSGNQHRLYMDQTLGSNTAQTAEGVVGSPIFINVVNNTSTIGQYSDYLNFSDLSLQTAIDPALEHAQREMAYRLGLTLSQLARNVADGAAIIDPSVANGSLAYNVPFTKNAITSSTQSLVGRNVAAFDRGRMTGVIHPFIVGDAINDNSNNSIVDVLKRTVEGQEKLSELPAPDGDEVSVLEWGGVSFHQSTLVNMTSNYQSQAGKTALRTYIFGEDALICISLGKKEGSMIGDGDWRNLKIWMMKAGEPTVGDPARVIGGWTSYNVKTTFTLPPDTTMRMRYIDAVSNVS